LRSPRRRLIAAIIGLIALLITPTALCAGLGVKAGDWIEYDIQESFSPEHAQRLDFLSIAGNELTIRVTEGTIIGGINQTESIDFSTDQDFQTAFLTVRAHVIPAGSEAGDSVYLGMDFGNRTISGETTRTYAGAERTVVYSNFSLQLNRYVLSWDKQTGVLVEATISAGTASKSLSTVDTSMWTGGIGWWLWLILGAAIVLGIVVSRKDVTRKLNKKRDAQRADKPGTE
jgi:hypothetical protein